MSTTRSDLRRALASVKPAVSHERTILVSCTHEGLAIEAHNFDVRLAVGHQTEPSVVVPFGILADAAQRFDDGPIDLAMEPGTLTLIAGSVVLRVPTRAANEWTPWSRGPEGASFLLDDDACEAIDRVRFAASSDDARPILTSVELSNETVAATDSYRIAIADVDLDLGEPILLPADAAQYLPVDTEDDLILTRYGDGKRSSLGWDFGPLRVDVRTVDGKYPTWQPLLPTAFMGTVEVDKIDLASSLRRLARWTKPEEAQCVRLVREAADKIALVVTGVNAVDVTDYLAADFRGEWPDRGIAFNPGYLADGVEAMLDPTVTLKVVDPVKPAIFAEEGFRYLVMPVRVH